MNAWITQMFNAQAARKYGVVRRSRADVQQYASMQELLVAVREKGFHLIETGDQVVVICNAGVLKIHA